MPEKWIIENWMGQHVFVDEEFESFEEARDFISDYAEEEAAKDGGVRGDDDYEETYDGICEDLYAVPVDEGEVADEE